MLAILINTGFLKPISSLELGVFFVVLNCIYLSFMQIHALFYFNYTIYSGLLIFCCQNVATCLNFFWQIKTTIFKQSIHSIIFLACWTRPARSSLFILFQITSIFCISWKILFIKVWNRTFYFFNFNIIIYTIPAEWKQCI